LHGLPAHLETVLQILGWDSMPGLVLGGAEDRTPTLWGARTRPCLLSWSLDGSLGSVDEAAEGRTVLAPAARCEHGVGPRKVNARYVRGLSQVDGGA